MKPAEVLQVNQEKHCFSGTTESFSSPAFGALEGATFLMRQGKQE